MANEEAPVTNAEIQELSLLLENRTFVDYFNVFLSLPVFGQHVFYNYVEAEFEFEPPIKQRRHLYLDRREILKWLFEHRLRLFRQSPLYTEYNLSTRLRTVECSIPGLKDSDEDGEDRNTFTRNAMGTAAGMMMFRESVRGTCGENVYRCWKDIEAWRLMKDPVRKMFWKNAIRTKYICQSSTAELKGKIKLLVYRGVLNFDLTPDDDVQQTIIDNLLTDNCVQSVESDDAMKQLQAVLLGAMKSYWVPRHLIHIAKSTPEEALSILRRPAPGDMEYLSHERKLRCRFMFPTIYQDSSVASPVTPVFTSKSAGDLPTNVVTPEEEVVEEEVAQIEPIDLLSLCGGPAKDISFKPISPSSYTSSFPSDDSPDEVSRRRLQSSASNQTRHVKSPIPIILTSYLGGKKRTLLGRFPKVANRVVWSLASDLLACCPFRSFLERQEHIFDLHYLSFWTDVRNYLDTDESAMDCFGQPLRRNLAHKLVQSYLSQSGEYCDIFSETLKMSLLHAIANNNDVSLLCMAQDIVQESLWEPLKLYIEDERKGFLKQVRGKRYNTKPRKHHQVENAAKQSRSDSSVDSDRVDPICFFNCAMIETESPDGSPSPTIPCTSAMSRPATSYHISITEEQMWKAMEIAVLCCEYGTSMMLPQSPPKPEDLVDILHSDYGSLHVSRVPTTRHEWLKSLLCKPKINIETIRVSRKVYLEKVDISIIKKGEPERDEAVARQRNRLVIRRNGLVLDRPTKPRTFIEVLTTSIHFDFFKRFMLVHKAGLPLFFWKAIEDLKDLSNAKTRQIRVTQIIRKFFGKYAKYGASLDCHEEIIRQIPNMEKVTPGILICAQAAVYRSMERKWYPQYLETYPPESESSGSPTVLTTTIAPRNNSPEMAEVVNFARKSKRRSYGSRKTLQLWRNLTKALAEFCKAIDCKSETQLLDIFLKCEVEKEQTTGPKEAPNQLQQVEKNIMMSSMAANVQTRVVIRNRLVILNRLPQDLKFWIEVKKYQELVDSAFMKGNMSAQDTEFLCDKARSVIACYLQSDVTPRVQVNIPNDMALNIINGLASGGPTRGLFHDAVILLFPLLYHFWRKFQDEWMNGDIPDDYIDTIERAFRDKVAITPHPGEPTPSYKIILDCDIKTITQPMQDDTSMKIHFSIAEGVSFVYPQPKLQKSATAAGRRMTKHSLHALTEELSSRKESRTTAVRQTGTAKSGDEAKQSKPTPPKEKKRPEKITVKELEKRAPAVNELVGKRSSMEKAKRLSMLVESLNKERDEKFKEQNKKYSKIMSFEAVVEAAMHELSDTNSVFS